ncbi:NACHT domain-containing protein [Floridanema evergladense]|uniref:NACHT domain-containing NTPase n=1 Tax=Floridaenema evergladense BLCC-F167 TaxID=3153639 RepID=A0ABV4WK77_9CYAN
MTTLKASQQGLAKIKQARKEKGWPIDDPRWQIEASQELEPNGTWTEHDFYATGISLPTWRRFLAGKEAIQTNAFKVYCKVLNLNWEEVVDRTQSLDPPQIEIDALMQKIRKHCYDRIQDQCGTMRMMDISHPVDVDNFYVEVNILEQIASQQWLEISDLLQQFSPIDGHFDRLGLGRVRQQRVPGLEAVKTYLKLMVLGKPGAGKTTFLKYLAIQCNKGVFEPNRVPFFIPLQVFSEEARDTSNFNLLAYIHQEYAIDELAEQWITERLLSEGRGLILLDGLDEVLDEESDEVVKQIRKFARKYYQNQVIITCRIATQKYRFNSEGFTEVEIADFNEQQIADFAKNWFVALNKNNQKEGETKAEQFIKKLNLPKNKRIRDLTVTPILLNLICLVFQEKVDFPSKRSKLYEQGLDILLVKWDREKGIHRDTTYFELSVPRKKQLLSQVATITFEQGDYFFEKSKIQKIIADYLCTLPNAKTDPDELEIDSETVLKSIETQHGLLVERARGIYSFSHLTFQEYFTAPEGATTKAQR